MNGYPALIALSVGLGGRYLTSFVGDCALIVFQNLAFGIITLIFLTQNMRGMESFRNVLKEKADKKKKETEEKAMSKSSEKN